MRLTFIYQPVDDLAGAITFYRDQLTFDEAWREGDDTVAFRLPDQSAQLMISTDRQPAGPMYLVDSLDEWLRDHSELTVSVAKFNIPGGSVAGIAAPGGNTLYVFDQPDT